MTKKLRVTPAEVQRVSFLQSRTGAYLYDPRPFEGPGSICGVELEVGEATDLGLDLSGTTTADEVEAAVSKWVRECR